MHTQTMELDIAILQDVFGVGDANLKTIEQQLQVSVLTRDGTVEIKGAEQEQTELAAETLKTLGLMRHAGESIDEFTVLRVIDLVRSGDSEAALAAMKDVVVITYRGAPIKCRTIGQRKYIDAIRKNTVSICIGPAGTGKTYLAVAAVVAALKRKEIDKIIMCRPAVEAGEKLGFLPGDLQNKVDPYLRPLYDALDEILGHDTVQKYVENRTIEVAPLAYMRGRTLKNAGVIVDECQNLVMTSLKMILTRLGEGSKMILTGDVTQIDLPVGSESGLRKCAELLRGIEGIEVTELSGRDVVRHKLVGQIVKAFEKYEEQTAPPARRQGTRYQKK